MARRRRHRRDGFRDGCRIPGGMRARRPGPLRAAAGRAAHGHLDGFCASRPRRALALRGGVGAGAAGLEQRRDGCLHLVRGRIAAEAGAPWQDQRSVSRRRRAGVGRRGPARRRQDRGDGGHHADAVDATALLERRGWGALSRRLLLAVPRRVAPRRLDPPLGGRQLHDRGPVRRHAQPRRRAHGRGGHLRRRRGTGRDRGQPRHRPRAARRRVLHAAVRCAECGHDARCGARAHDLRDDPP